jgi:hypothetical protein
MSSHRDVDPSVQRSCSMDLPQRSTAAPTLALALAMSMVPLPSR